MSIIPSLTALIEQGSRRWLTRYRHGHPLSNRCRGLKRCHPWGRVNLVIWLCCVPMLGLADGGLAETLHGFLGYLTGDVGKAVSTVAIVGVGFLCFGMGRVPKETVIAVVIGVGIIFGADAIMSALGHGSL